MLSIQDGAKILLSDSPQGIYFLTGPDYGVKNTYLDKLQSTYSEVIQSESLTDLISSFNRKTLIPRLPSIYIVRYDKHFISTLDGKVAERVLNTKIPGIVIAIYEEDKDESKLDKHFPNNTIRVNNLSPAVACKHLKGKYESLSDQVIGLIESISIDFYEADIMCRNIELLGDKANGLTRLDYMTLFGKVLPYNQELLKDSVLARDFKTYVKQIDSYDGDYSPIFYDILNALLKMVSYIDRGNRDDKLARFSRIWTYNELVYMFNEVYDQVKTIRSNSSYNPYISLLYIGSLLNYRVG